jgi:hypothetical protein
MQRALAAGTTMHTFYNAGTRRRKVATTPQIDGNQTETQFRSSLNFGGAGGHSGRDAYKHNIKTVMYRAVA